MLAGQYEFTKSGWVLAGGEELARPDLVMIFGSAEPEMLRGASAALRGGFPEAQIVGCTSGGELIDGRLIERGVVALALQFTHAHVHAHSARISHRRDSFAVGRRLGQAIDAPALGGVLLLAEGVDCDGGRLLAGLSDVLDEDVPIFGGLAGDGLDFVLTRVAANGPFETGQAVAVGLYGKSITIGQGIGTGWLPGRRVGAITNASGSIIYEIDQRQALAVVQRAAGIMERGSCRGLMTEPLWITDPHEEASGMIRTVIGVNDAHGALIMSGDLPRQAACHLMSTSPEAIAEGAAEAAASALATSRKGVALCVSCVGRKHRLGAAAPAEALALKQVLRDMPQIGFYGYGGLGGVGRHSRFLNQTMCVTTIGELGR